jgi:hypothetical protein
MKVAHPLDRAYHFEITARNYRLMYYTPATKLRAEARKKLISESILRDYPYGVEVDVDNREYGYLEQLYRFVPPVPAQAAWWAFRGLLHNVGSMLYRPALGWINADLLERYAGSLFPSVEEWLVENAQAEAKQTKEAIEQEERRQGLWSLLSTYPPEDVNSEVPWDQQPWGKVRMSAGLPAIKMFDRIQHPKRSRKRGNRR